jgi:hypothetical protein
MGIIDKTRALAGLGLAALALSFSGCIVETSSNSCSADLHVSWNIDDAATGAALTCEQVPADTVQVILDGQVLPSNCSAYSTQINNIPLGTHSVELRLMDGSTSKSDTGAMNVSLASCITYDLNGGTPVTFDVN